MPPMPDPPGAVAASARNMYSIAALCTRCGAQWPPARARTPFDRASRITR